MGPRGLFRSLSKVIVVAGLEQVHLVVELLGATDATDAKRWAMGEDGEGLHVERLDGS